MNADLPHLRPRPFDTVHAYIAGVLTAREQDLTSLRQLITLPDGRYRALFAPDYFVLAAGSSEPTKSQWNSLKKKMKRHHHGVFVFKAHGMVSYQGEPCCWVEFGFFAE